MSWYRAVLVTPVRKTDGTGLTDVMRGDLLEITGVGPVGTAPGLKGKIWWETYVVRIHRKRRFMTDVDVFMPKPMFESLCVRPLSPLEQLAKMAEV